MEKQPKNIRGLNFLHSFEFLKFSMMSLNKYDCGGFRMAFDGTKLMTIEIIKDKLVYVFIS